MMTVALRNLIRERAGKRCEYCKLHESDADFFTFHVEHVVPKQHGGRNDFESLCYSCAECNWHKGTNLAGLLSGRLYALFNPRTQEWRRHFRWDHTTLVGKTKSGIVTIQVLNINDAVRMMLRENLLLEGRFPPP